MTSAGDSHTNALVTQLYVLLAETETLEDFLTDLADIAAEEIDRDLSCGLTARMDARPITVASSDEAATQLDQVQYESGEGPCLDAMATGQRIEVTDLTDGENWPAWRAHARAQGLQKSLSVPLTAADTTLGALNLYSTSAAKFTTDDRDAADRFAAQAGGALAVAVRLAEQADLANHLRTALTSRAVIDQAKGILMAEERCTAEEAFALLRTASQQRNTKLRDIAQNIVTAVTTRSPSSPRLDPLLPRRSRGHPSNRDHRHAH